MNKSCVKDFTFFQSSSLRKSFLLPIWRLLFFMSSFFMRKKYFAITLQGFFCFCHYCSKHKWDWLVKVRHRLHLVAKEEILERFSWRRQWGKAVVVSCRCRGMNSQLSERDSWTVSPQVPPLGSQLSALMCFCQREKPCCYLVTTTPLHCGTPLLYFINYLLIWFC